MWWAKRRGDGAVATDEAPAGVDRALAGDLALLQDKIEQLIRVNAASADPEVDRRLLRLAHLAGIALAREAPDDPQFAAGAFDALPEWDPLPEVAAGQLTPGLISAGLLRHGCLLVRGLVPREQATAMAKQIAQAFDQRERYERGRNPKAGYYEEFLPEPGSGEPVVRGWIKQGGGLLAADAPRLHFEMVQMFRAAGLPALVSGYLGEPALISLHKTTLRKADPSVPGAWHQDGFFMGPVRSLNLWLSLSHCGDEAPGLDMLPRRLDSYLATNTEEAALDYTISQVKVEQAAGDTPIIRPVFEPGDAVFFDELFLHQTGSDAAMRNPRYAIENWFFGGSAFPAEYAPIAL